MDVREIAKAALIKGGVQDPSESQVEILGVMITRYVEQQLKGLSKYGVPIGPLDNYDWLDMKLEEDIDGAVYQICKTIQRRYELDQYDKTMTELRDLLEKGEITMERVRELVQK